MNDDLLEPRLSRAAALRLAAAGAAGLALGVRPARAAPSDAADVEAAARAFLAVAGTGRASSASFGVRQRRAHPLALDGAFLGAAERPAAGCDVGRAAQARARVAAREQLDGRLPQGGRTSWRSRACSDGLDTGIADPFDPDLFYVSVFGTPGARAWGWRFEGHHLSRHFTVVKDTLVAEPFFLGAWPTRADSAYRSVAKGYRTMPREEDAAREIVLLLDGALRKRVVFSQESLTDHLTQNAVRVRPLERVGVLTARTPLRGAATRRRDRAHVPREPSSGDGARRRSRASSGRAASRRTRFGWAGSTRRGVPHYYRLQGPTFVLEFDNSRNSGTHIHSVWRDFERDFGRHLL